MSFAGQSSTNICVQPTATIQNGGDATALSGCQTFTGSIVIASSTPGDLDFSGIRQITGSLSAQGARNVTSITASTLGTVGNALDLEGLIGLNALNFGNLTSVGSLTFHTLGPNLQVLNWGTGLKTVGALDIQDTFLQNLNGINLTSAQSINIANNQYLTDINIPLTSITGAINLNANAAGRTAASFGNLTSAGSISISNCSTVNLAALMNTTGQVALTSNGFSNLSLTQLYSSNGLIIQNNNQMTALSLPAYNTDNGALSIENNTMLQSAISLPALVKVSGAAVFRGSFTNLTTPNLNTLAGAMTIVSTAPIDSVCSHYNGIQGASNIVQGVVTCNGGKATTSSGSGSGSSSGTAASGSASASSSSKPSSGNNVAVPTVTLLGALAAFFAMLA